MISLDKDTLSSLTSTASNTPVHKSQADRKLSHNLNHPSVLSNLKSDEDQNKISLSSMNSPKTTINQSELISSLQSNLEK